MNIGYACLTVGVCNTDLKSCIQKNATSEKLIEIIGYNLNSLEKIIEYNMKSGIKLFRISSDLIPFGSSPVNTTSWWNLFESQLKRTGKKINDYGMRVSMHPGQYTVLNSPAPDVVKSAIVDLSYHARVLDSLGMNEEHKIILHIGGVYGDKKLAIQRFIANYHELPDAVKMRLVIENDDKSYNIADVLEIGESINVPVVFDTLHNQINPTDEGKTELFWIKECANTWDKKDGRQKIHYSQQDPSKKPGSHSGSIRINEFMIFWENMKTYDVDIMLEVKNKNLSAVKCINCTNIHGKISALELEWSKYKYSVLENSPSDYLEIRKLLREKSYYPAISFYNLVENALQREKTIGNCVNAAHHVWGYFKEKASDEQSDQFLSRIKSFSDGLVSLDGVKRFLFKLAHQYEEKYLLDSYYFII